MKIGEFARVCGTKISVLRHYDREGLLHPVYVDRFTEYRYYDMSQKAIFDRIGELKAAGFSLAEIRTVIYSGNAELTERLFEEKQTELENMLLRLSKLKEDMGGNFMESTFRPFVEIIELAFENDERVIGKWEAVSENGNIGSKKRELYFLPKGESYWCYSWTKGKLIYDDGVNRFANDYRIEERGDDIYMIVSFKSFDYEKTRETAAVALRKLDSRYYTKEETARRDDISKPFFSDSRVIGKWKSVFYADDTSKNIDTVYFSEENRSSGLYFREIEFFEGGSCTSVYGDEVISGDNMQVWTKGFVLRKWNSTACAYKLRSINGREYLVMEWKSGDYRWGGSETDYYVFERA
ncbi:MAG: MerR family transcriptional regulator [Oscillospiraceae bacterium]|nr:MerR family transcriptional regulator [Oscillospiraceae bacterium]